MAQGYYMNKLAKWSKEEDKDEVRTRMKQEQETKTFLLLLLYLYTGKVKKYKKAQDKKMEKLL